MTNESKLLEILKRMYKAGYKFGFTNNNDPSSYIHWQDDGGNVFRIPHYSEVEERIVELARIKLKKMPNWTFSVTWREETCHRNFHANIFLGDGLERHSIFAIHPNRLIAVCQLWLELQKLNKENEK